mmetsp:Transcript_4488/g.9655  ORF Transcript_4488/g.9655 Transcript_4488/m.9655 type:complete len:130 (-) Transcript_4488:518-907(-)|eukprot:CAMPEP_0202893806 /NCGR_PEP_ID=MMETSP1392-20130828/3315_1 /ASSEMBLY_ACC=CAM_ASM_000868 /TAXON_ID=225041 /ORGANISM="Chlamydomonas chlamydogama, Strain SAG 11-48b" /LENGTH=129 /DNA_ID=CAMNT_0049578265 /DNA_START=64 /DNA_END=453 /DNA_ORIENTATION=-
MSHLAKAAEVPAHRDPSKDPADFVALNKSLRACFVCRLIKSEMQFLESGCDNCQFLELEGDRARTSDYTTPSFAGMISVMDPATSWASKWMHLGKYVPGCYALVINEQPPDSLRDMLEDRGIKINHGDT